MFDYGIVIVGYCWIGYVVMGYCYFDFVYVDGVDCWFGYGWFVVWVGVFGVFYCFGCVVFGGRL